MSTTPSIASVVNDLRNQNQNLPTEKKQNIIVVQDNASASEADKTGQMLTVLNNIFNAVSEQLRLTRESFRLQKEESRLAAKDFQKEAMDVSSGKYEPQEYDGGGGGGASPAGGEGGVIEQAGKVGGGLWESAKGLGKAAVGVVARHPIATAVGAGAAIGTGIGIMTGGNKKIGRKLQDSPYTNLQDTMGISNEQYDVFRRSIADIESRGGEYGITGGSSNRFSGAYQMGATEIRESAKAAGIKPPSRQEFLNNPQLQELLFAKYTEGHHKILMRNKKYASLSKEEQLEVLGYAHNQGAGGASKWLRTGRPGKDAFGTSGTAYSSAIHKNLTRLRQGDIKYDEPEKNKNTATKLTSNGEQTEPQRINSVIRQQQKGATRNLAITDTLDQKLSEAIQAVYGEGYTGSVYSGGQHSHGGKRTGTHRHDEGHAADFRVYDPKGKLISGNKLAPLAQYWRAMNYGGIGLEMGKGGIHLDERKEEFLRKYGGKYDWSYGTRTKEQLAAIKAGERGILPELARPELAGITQGQQTKLASNEEQLPKSGRHQLERTDEKSSVLQASMFAPLEKAIDKMSNILTSIEKNTGKTEENTKEIKTASKEEQTKTEETETPTATKAEEEQDQSQDLVSMMGGSDEGSNVMKMLFGQGGFMGSAEPIEPGSAKRKYIDSLPSHTDKIGEMVRNFLLGEGDIDVNEALGALGQSGTATPQGTSNKLENLGVTPTMSQNFTEQPKNLGVTPISETEQFLNGLGITPFNNQQQETQLNYQKTNQLANLGVNPFGGQQGGMLNNIFSGGPSRAGNNPFYSMQGMLGRIGSVASMGQNIGGMMQQGGLGGARNVVGQVGGILQGMDSGFPMSQGIGGMMRNVGSIMGSVQGMQNIGRGGMGGVMGGIGAASGVLGSLGNIFGNVQGMSGGLGKMMGGLGVTPFGGGGSSGGGKSVSSLGIGDDVASLKKTYSESSESMGGNLESLQSSNDELSSPSQASLSTDKGNTQPPGAGGGMPADRGSISSSQGASAAPKSGAGARTGTSSGAMGNSMEGYNDCPTLYKWQFRTSYWGKV